MHRLGCNTKLFNLHDWQEELGIDNIQHNMISCVEIFHPLQHRWHQHSSVCCANSPTCSHFRADSDEDDDEFTPRDAGGNELAVDLEPNALTAAQLQEELTKRGLDVKWQPLKGKKVLVERLQVCPHSHQTRH